MLLLLALGFPSAARASETFGDDVYYLGDPHAHTGVSGDGGSADLGDCTGTCGDFSTVVDTARDNGLDWVALADHVNGDQAASEDDYAMLTETVIDGDDPSGGFVTLPAAEVWFREAGDVTLGHKTLLLFGDDTAMAGLSLTDVQPMGSTIQTVEACEDIWTWMDELTAAFGPALLIPHHPALTQPMPTDWGCHSDTWEPEVEVYSAHGNSLTITTTYDPPWSGPTETGTVEAALDPDGYGLRMGFMGGTDGHDTRPGSTCDTDTEMTNHPYGGGLTVIAVPASTALSRSALYDAILAHHTYATTGPLVPLAVAFQSGGAALGALGDDVGLPAGQPLDVTVTVPAADAAWVTAVTLVGPDGTAATLDGDGTGGWTTQIAADSAPAYLYVAVEMDGAAIYGSATACADGGDDAVEWLWASPSWIDVVPADLDGDGIAWADGDCDDGDPDISPSVLETWYDGVDQDCDGNDQDQDGDGVIAAELGGPDCDDTDPAAFPGAPEVWYDGQDEDCSGDGDDDQDLDGWSAREMGGPDCDDRDPAISPAATEVWYDGVDQDCDGTDADQDGDGSPYPLDCDDADPTVQPGQGGLDDDCHPLASGVLTGRPTMRLEDGGCSAVGGGGGWALVGIGVLLVGRRRAGVSRWSRCRPRR